MAMALVSYLLYGRMVQSGLAPQRRREVLLSLWLLVLGHIMRALPYVVLVVQARLIGVRRVYEEAAMSLGANRFQTFREVTLPLLMPAIVASLLLVFGSEWIDPVHLEAAMLGADVYVAAIKQSRHVTFHAVENQIDAAPG